MPEKPDPTSTPKDHFAGTGSGNGSKTDDTIKKTEKDAKENKIAYNSVAKGSVYTNSLYKNFPFISQIYPEIQTALNNKLNSKSRDTLITPWVKALSGAISPSGGRMSLQSIKNSSAGGWENTTNYKFEDLYVKKNSYRPISGITSVDIDYKSTFGGIRRAKIHWVCHSLGDLNEMAPFFLNAGKTIFLEWGWNTGITHNIDASGLDVNNYYDRVVSKIKKSGGTYDAMIGYTTNFSYNINDDLSYECMTEIMSAGGLIQGASLNNQKFLEVSNISSNDKEDANKDGTNDKDEQTLLNYIKLKLSDDVSNAVSSSKYGNFWKSTVNTKSDVVIYKDIVGETTTDTTTTTTTDTKTTESTDAKTTESTDTSVVTANDASTYISWGYVEDEVFSAGGLNLFINGGNTQIMRFDSSGIPIKNHPCLRTTDLSVCFLPVVTGYDSTENWLTGFEKDYSGLYYNNSGTNDNSENNSKNNNTAFVRNIFVNLAYFKQKFSSVDNLYDAILAVFSGINSACGNVWDFKIGSSPDHSRYYVCDISYLNSKDMKMDSKTTFIKGPYTFTTKKSSATAGLIKDLSIETDLTDAIAMNIFYSSNKKDNDTTVVNGTNEGKSTFFNTEYKDTYINYIEDRTVKGESKDYVKEVEEIKKKTEDQKKREEKDKENIVAQGQEDAPTNEGEGDADKPAAESTEAQTNNLPSDVKQYYGYDAVQYSDMLKHYLPVYPYYSDRSNKYWFTEGMKRLILRDTGTADDNRSTISNSIIPIKARLSLEGISGVKIGDCFHVDCLPNRYRQRGTFQIIELRNTINQEGWFTEFRGLYRIIGTKNIGLPVKTEFKEVTKAFNNVKINITPENTNIGSTNADTGSDPNADTTNYAPTIKDGYCIDMNNVKHVTSYYPKGLVTKRIHGVDMTLLPEVMEMYMIADKNFINDPNHIGPGILFGYTFRSDKTQDNLYRRLKKKNKNYPVAKSGHSRHRYGIAIDVHWAEKGAHDFSNNRLVEKYLMAAGFQHFRKNDDMCHFSADKSELSKDAQK